VDAIEALGEPVRRRIVELLAEGSRPAGDLAGRVGTEFGISQPATSRHLRVLREADVVTSTIKGQQRIYALNHRAMDDLAEWVEGVRSFWTQRLDSLETELARGRRARTDRRRPRKV
jgi:DNA-binding transcriptional ArsR family regulator